MDLAAVVDTSVPPLPSDASEAARWLHTRLRRRLIYGVARDDVRERMALAFGPLRSDVIGEPDLSGNPFMATCSAAAALYDREPRVSHPVDIGAAAPAAAEVLGGYLRRAGLWPLMQRVQRDTLGLREMLVRVEVTRTQDGHEVVYHPTPPDLVIATADPDRPDRLASVRIAEQRADATGARHWVWVQWDRYGSEITQSGEVVTGVRRVLSHTGDLIEWVPLERDELGQPILPWVLYHAALTGHLWDPYHGSEIVYGTLDMAVLWSWHSHILRNAAFEVRYTMGATVGGLTQEGSGATARQRGVVDPTVVIPLVPDPDYQGQPQVGAWSPSADPLVVAESIVIRERRLVAFAGLSPADVHRASGDPRSGYSLAVTREGQREAQRRYGPIFAPVDEGLLGITCALLRAAGGPALPETGWRVSHTLLPASPEERDAERSDVLALVGAGLLSKVEARARLLGETMVEAAAALAVADGAAAPPGGTDG